MAFKPLPIQTNSSIDVVNAIRNSASVDYRNYVPYAYESSDLRTIGNIIMDDPQLMNEFIKPLINRISLAFLTSDAYQNPWKALKKGILSKGEVVEEIFADLIKGFAFDADADGSNAGLIFKRYEGNIHTAFHYTNVMCYYPNSVEYELLDRAFNSDAEMQSFIKDGLIGAIYDSMEYDEFQLIKYLIAKRACNGQIATVDISGADTNSDITAIIKGVSNDFRFKKSKYNPAGVKTKSDPDRQYIILNTAFDAKVSVDVLAVAFNMDKAEFLGHKLLVDDFGDIDEDRLASIIGSDAYEPLTSAEKTALSAVPAALFDDRFFQIYDKYLVMKEQENVLSLRWNYMLHNAKIISSSPFHNAVLFTNGSPTVASVTINPTAVTASAGQTVQFTSSVSVSNFGSKAVIYTLSGANSDDTVIDERGILRIASDEDSTEITVTATSVADSTKSASATVTIA